MPYTVSAVENVNVDGLYRAADDFGVAGYWFGDAETTFAAEVKTPVESGAAWSGAGQPDAVTVLEINRSAMEISTLQMESANNATKGLEAALRSVKTKIASVKAEAAGLELVVSDKGTVGGDPNLPYDSSQGKIETARRLAREAQGALLFAATADANAAALLSRIGSHIPSYSDVADVSVLNHNQAALEETLADYEDSFGLREFWEKAQPQAIPEHFVDSQAILDLITGVTLVGLGGLLTGAGFGGEFASVVVSVTGVGTVVGVPGVALSSSVVAAGLGTVSYGAGLVDRALQVNSSSGGSSSAPRYKPGANKSGSRVFGKSASDIAGKAKRYGARMEAKGYKVEVPPVRRTKYGRPDVTVTVFKYDPGTREWVVHHIRHFMSRTRNP